ILQFVICLYQQLTVSLLSCFSTHFCEPHLFGGCPTEQMSARLSFPCAILQFTENVGGLIHQIEGCVRLVRHRRRAMKTENIPVPKLVCLLLPLRHLTTQRLENMASIIRTYSKWTVKGSVTLSLGP